MSVQVKKKFEELVTYLGKDTKGLEKVKQLKDAVNELRKKLAAAEERLEQVEAVKDAARERADRAEADKAAAEQAREAAVVTRQQLEWRLSQIAMQKLEKEADEDMAYEKLTALVNDSVEKEEGIDFSNTLQAIRRLRSRSPECVPQVATVSMLGQPLRIFSRHQLATGWGDEDLWQLGASVALLSATYGLIMVATGQSPEVRVTHFRGSTAGMPIHVAIAAETVAWTKQQMLPGEDHYATLEKAIRRDTTGGYNT